MKIAGVPSVFRRLRDVLPAGRSLPEEQWVRRHKTVVVLLWAHAVFLFCFGLVRGESVHHAGLEGGVIAVMALMARSGRSRAAQSAVGALGLVVASAVFVHLSGGVIEVHFHFFVMVAVLMLYQEWTPYLVAIGFVVLQHGVMGVLDPTSVYNHGAAVNQPWKWAAIHGAFVLAASCANLVTWRLHELARIDADDAYQQLADSETRFRSYFADASVGQAMSLPDGHFVAVNAAFCRITGYSEQELLSVSGRNLTHPADRAAHDDRMHRLLLGEFDAYEIEKRFVRKDGETVNVLNSVSTIRAEDGSVRYITVVVQDITERERAQRALISSEARYRGIVETAHEGVWILDDHGRTTFVNRRMGDLLGYRADQLMGRDLVDFVHESERATALARLTALRDGSSQPELRFVRSDGGELWALLATSPVVDETGVAVGTLAMVSDITERKAAEDALLHQAFHDTLTGLPNRALFLDRLDQALARRGRRQTEVAVIFLDIDRFKLVNDSLGHAAGDDLLSAVTAQVVGVLEEGETVARLGGDEFVILCDEIAGVDDSLATAERVVRSLAAPFTVADRDIGITASLGIAVSGPGVEVTAENLLRDADVAMYRAKERGRNRVEVFDEEMRAHAVARLEMAAALRQAIDADQLHVHYQPVVDLGGEGIVGVEALVRWRRGESFVPPGVFIPVAEESDLIVRIGNAVLAKACLDVAEWNGAHPNRRPLSVAVNISARQLDGSDLYEQVEKALATSGLPADLLCLEITETALLTDPEATKTALERVKALGVRVAVDDFGTGYASLLYLRKFPVDELKIDRSFVAGLGQDEADTAIVLGVVDLARALGLTAVAEGVETAEQAAHLTAAGCQLGQGYHWAKPMPADELARWLEGYWTAATTSAPRPEVASVPPAAPVPAAPDSAPARPALRVVASVS